MVSGRRGQGGMEYMGSYGWAILVVIMVGIAMYAFGILNWNPVASPSASGFKEVQPFLPTAQIRDSLMNIAPNDYNGFSVQLVNAGGASIIVRDVNIVVNDAPCAYQAVWIEPNVRVFSSSMVPLPNNCFYTTGPLCGSDTDRTVPRDTSFRVYAMTRDNLPSGTPCDNIAINGKYVVDIDITYDIAMGEMGVNTAEKHSTGEIILSGTSK